jgi:hypothetical protein
LFSLAVAWQNRLRTFQQEMRLMWFVYM